MGAFQRQYGSKNPLAKIAKLGRRFEKQSRFVGKAIVFPIGDVIQAPDGANVAEEDAAMQLALAFSVDSSEVGSKAAVYKAVITNNDPVHIGQ